MLFITLAVGCQNSTEEQEDKLWPLPFSGYICGLRGTDTFLQLPILCTNEKILDINEISDLKLLGTDITFTCENPSLSTPLRSKMDAILIVTFSFSIKLDQIGEFSVNQLRIEMKNGAAINLELGELIIVVQTDASPEQPLSMRRFRVNQIDASRLAVSFFNHSNHPISVQGFTFPEKHCSGNQFVQYNGINLVEIGNPIEGSTIQPQTECFFVVDFSFDAEFLSNMGRFYYLLPYVTYEYQGKYYTIPAQTQATVIQAPLTEETIKKIIQSK